MLKKLSFALLVTFVAVGCRSGNKVEEATLAPETKAVARQNNASYVAEVKFDKGSAALNDASRAELDRVIAAAAAAGKIDEIKIMTWADANYPADAQKALPKPQRDLVERRNKAMNDYVKSKTSDVDVDTFNMAERPNTLEKLFNTSDARLKRSLEQAGMNDTATPSVWRSNRHVSKSTVMVILDND